ncbi:PAS domain S-box protein, partial [Candidatus Bathyarchaeota archaeon]|nr:PAS domain S-box protein [Candidatus Bathyarchaeota archaeon]
MDDNLEDWPTCDWCGRELGDFNLELAEGRLRNIFSASPNAITTTDIYGVITDCNNATLEIHGYDSKDEVIGRSAFEFMAPHERELAEERFKELLDLE